MDMSSTQHSSGANSSRNLVRQAADPASRMTDALLKRSKTKGNIDQPRTLASFPAAMPPLPDTGIDEAIATLSGQQYRVFMLLGDGQTNKQIGRVLGIAESTVKAHVSVVFAKLGCKKRTMAALLAVHDRHAQHIQKNAPASR
jgi:DNA-binding NarL/FixJ family response regulator